MRHVPIAEFKDKVSEMMAAAEAGDDVVITRHGKAVIKLVPIAEARLAERNAAIDRMFALGKEMRAKYGPFSMDEIIAWKNEGRR